VRVALHCLRSRHETVDPSRVLLPMLAGLGAVCALVATGPGVGLSPDSVAYIAAARNLLHGYGISSYLFDVTSGRPLPLTHFPPLYPALLALIGLAGIDPLAGARWLNAILFAGNIYLVGSLVRQYTQGVLGASLAAPILIALSTIMLLIHTYAWSEPAFVFLCILALFLLARYFDAPSYRLLAASGVAMALAFLTRYAAPPLIATGLIALLVFGRGPLRAKLGRASLLIVVSCAPMGLWMARNVVLIRAPTDRAVTYQPVLIRKIAHDFQAIAQRILLPAWNAVHAHVYLAAAAASALAILLGALGLAFWPRGRREPLAPPWHPSALVRLPALFGLFTAAYLGFLFVSISFFDAGTPLDRRILSPVYVCAVILAACLGHRLLARVPMRPGRQAVLLVCGVLLVGVCLRATLNWMRTAASDGQDYASKAWAQSATMREVERFYRDRRIFSNAPDAVYIVTGSLANMIPGLQPALYAAGGPTGAQGTVIVYFKAVNWRSYIPTETELTKSLPLTLLSSQEDGSIYSLATPGG
jgi:hypothetical protein